MYRIADTGIYRRAIDRLLGNMYMRRKCSKILGEIAPNDSAVSPKENVFSVHYM
jgi:hypothetical protein